MPQVLPHTRCRLKLLRSERIKDYLLMEEEFISNQERLKPQEEKQEVEFRFLHVGIDMTENHIHKCLTHQSRLVSQILTFNILFFSFNLKFNEFDWNIRLIWVG